MNNNHKNQINNYKSNLNNQFNRKRYNLNNQFLNLRKKHLKHQKNNQILNQYLFLPLNIKVFQVNKK